MFVFRLVTYISSKKSYEFSRAHHHHQRDRMFSLGFPAMTVSRVTGPPASDEGIQDQNVGFREGSRQQWCKNSPSFWYPSGLQRTLVAVHPQKYSHATRELGFCWSDIPWPLPREQIKAIPTNKSLNQQYRGNPPVTCQENWKLLRWGSSADVPWTCKGSDTGKACMWMCDSKLILVMFLVGFWIVPDSQSPLRCMFIEASSHTVINRNAEWLDGACLCKSSPMPQGDALHGQWRGERRPSWSVSNWNLSFDPTFLRCFLRKFHPSTLC